MPGAAMPQSQYQTSSPVLSVAYNSTRTLAATVCADRTLKVWSHAVPSEPPQELLSDKLPAQVTCCCWAPEERGRLLAAGTAAGSIHILQQLPAPPSQQQQQQAAAGASSKWHWVAQISAGNGPVGAVAFAPSQLGLVLAVAVQPQPQRPGSPQLPQGSTLQLYEAPPNFLQPVAHWTHLAKVQATSSSPCCTLAWRSSTPGVPPLLLAGGDVGAVVWCYRQGSMTWEEVCQLPSPVQHPGSSAGQPSSTLAVDWAPPLGRPHELVATSYGTTVVLNKLYNATPADPTVAGGRGGLELEAAMEVSLQHPAPVWQVAFDRFGSAVACSLTGEATVWLWKPNMVGEWEVVGQVLGREVVEDEDMAAVDLD